VVVADDEAGRRMPFSFLTELGKRFTSAYTSEEITQAPPYSLSSYSSSIASLVNQYTTAPPPDAIRSAQTEINSVKDIMVENIDRILSRGERIELLVDKTDVRLNPYFLRSLC
jgi:vesicle-associated membrane protein 7